MAWTTPKTWVHGELLTATDFNSQLRDDFLHLRDLGNEQYFMRVSSVLETGVATVDTTYHTELFETPYPKTSLWMRYFGTLELNPPMTCLVHARVLFPIIGSSHTAFLNISRTAATGTIKGYCIMGQWQGIVGPTAINLALRYRVTTASVTIYSGTLIVGIIPTT
jgi:hypothetical protein